MEDEQTGNNHDYSFDVGKNIEGLGFGFLFFRYVWPLIGFLFLTFILGLLLTVIVRGG